MIHIVYQLKSITTLNSPRGVPYQTDSVIIYMNISKWLKYPNWSFEYIDIKYDYRNIVQLVVSVADLMSIYFFYVKPFPQHNTLCGLNANAVQTNSFMSRIIYLRVNIPDEKWCSNS